MTRTHLAVGPDGLNLLGFLASLGALAALTRAWPERAVRLSWTMPRSGPGAGGWRPVFHVEPPATQEEIVDTLYAQITDVHALEVLEGLDRNLRVSGAVLRERAAAFWEDRGDRRSADLLAALMADGGSAEEVRVSPLRALTGAGHMHFVDTLRALSDPSRLSRDHVARALFRPWAYEDVRFTFRWDPSDFRPYALRARDPARDPVHPIRTEWGANRLGFEALVLFPMTWSGAAIGFRGRELRWPLWRPPASADVVRSVLAHPALFAPEGEAAGLQLRALGVAAVVSARWFRGERGAHVYFTPARVVWAGGWSTVAGGGGDVS